MEFGQASTDLPLFSAQMTIAGVSVCIIPLNPRGVRSIDCETSIDVRSLHIANPEATQDQGVAKGLEQLDRKTWQVKGAKRTTT